jgi:glycosyltransferase involved in cell wall biosynthesis
MKYLGSIFGVEKEEVISSSSFYILPSYREGLPSSLLEAMAFGLVPIITEGCNLPEVFSSNLGVKITTDINSIVMALEETSTWPEDKIRETGSRCKVFILENYSLDPLTEKQLKIYSDVLS